MSQQSISALTEEIFWNNFNVNPNETGWFMPTDDILQLLREHPIIATYYYHGFFRRMMGFLRSLGCTRIRRRVGGIKMRGWMGIKRKNSR